MFAAQQSRVSAKAGLREFIRMPQRRSPTLSAQLRSMLGEPWDFPGRPLRHDYDQWTVDDDWPRPIPVGEAEVDLYEAYFGDLFDEMFGPSR